jgi:hypothetical protein
MARAVLTRYRYRAVLLGSSCVDQAGRCPQNSPLR